MTLPTRLPRRPTSPTLLTVTCSLPRASRCALRRVSLFRCLAFSVAVLPGCPDASRSDSGDTPAAQDADDASSVDADLPDAPAPDVPPPPEHASVTQFLSDIRRTGANRNERVLTPTSLRAGRLRRVTSFLPTLDGQLYAQPLYLPRLDVRGAVHDVVLVATQNNSLFALDADTGIALWQLHVGTPVPRASQPCGNIAPTVGVVGTPVIDEATLTLYAVSFETPDAGVTKRYVVHAVDVRTGVERAGYPQTIAPPASNGSTFDAHATGQRGASLLLNGQLYVTFGGLAGDCGMYHGWVAAIDVANPTRQSAFATPGRGSGLWAPGGLASDGTSLFIATGNGFTPDAMGEYVARIRVASAGPTFGGSSTDYFTPSDRLALDLSDGDVGSVTPLLIDHPGSRTPHLLFQGGKRGVGYLLNRDDLGGPGRGDGTNGEGLQSGALLSAGILGANATWSSARETYIFVSGRGGRAAPCTGGGGVVALRLRVGASGTSEFEVAWCTATIGNPGSPWVTSNGDASAILWVVGASPPTVRAYDIADGTEVFSDAPPSVRYWTPVVAADGRVFVTGQDGLFMYRLN